LTEDSQVADGVDGFNKIEFWAAFFQEYSGRQLTVAADKFPAIAGIVAELEILWGDVYLAGLWRSCIMHHLSWYRAYTPESSSATAVTVQNDDCIAPTWSWASLNQAVSWKDIKKPAAELHSNPIIPGSQNQLPGLGASDRLTIRAETVSGSHIPKAPEHLWDAGKAVYHYDYKGNKISDDAILAYLGAIPLSAEEIYLILEPVEQDEFKRVGILSVNSVLQKMREVRDPPRFLTIK
jgi:hypothetical protein